MGGRSEPGGGVRRKAGLLQKPTPHLPPTASLLSHACFLWGVVRIAMRKLGQNCLGPQLGNFPFPLS